MNFKDKVVVITGGTSGIGKQTAIEFSRKGAHVVAFTVDKEEVCKQAIKEIGNEAFYIHCDVSKEEDVKKAEEFLQQESEEMEEKQAEEITETKEIVDVDMKGVFLCLKYELLQMQKQGFGTIVNTASIGGYKMAPGFAAYGPAKAAVIALTEMAALENAAFGIRVNAICPGPTMGTELTKNSLSTNPHEEAMLKEHVIPMKKLAMTQEVVNAVLWLSSDQASHTTGQKIFIDGGMHIA